MMLLITYIVEHFDLLIFFTEQMLEEEHSWATNYFRIGLQSQDVRCSFVPCLRKRKIWTETESQFLSEESLSLCLLDGAGFHVSYEIFVCFYPPHMYSGTDKVGR